MSLNLDENLISRDSPSADVTSSLDYNSTNDRNNVTDYNFNSINANKITAGTITVGGNSGTVAGLLRVLDSNGGTIVTADANGLTVNNGSITIKDTGGTTVIDYLGLNSQSNFYNDSVSGGTHDTSSTAPVAIPGGTLDTIVLTRPTNIFIYISLSGRNSAYDSAGGCVVYDTYTGGTITDFLAYYKGIQGTDFDFGAGTVIDSFLYSQYVFNGRNILFPAGAHTLNIQNQVRSGSSGTAHLSGWELGIIKLGN